MGPRGLRLELRAAPYLPTMRYKGATWAPVAPGWSSRWHRTFPPSDIRAQHGPRGSRLELALAPYLPTMRYKGATWAPVASGWSYVRHLTFPP